MAESEAYWFEFLCQPSFSRSKSPWKAIIVSVTLQALNESFSFSLVWFATCAHDRAVFIKTKQIKDASGYLGVGKVVLPLWSKDFLCSSCHRLKLETKCVSMASAVQSEFSLKLRFFYFFLKKAGSQSKEKIKAQRAFSNFSKISAQNQTRQKGLNSNSGSKNALLWWGQFKKALVFVFYLWNVD